MYPLTVSKRVKCLPTNGSVNVSSTKAIALAAVFMRARAIDEITCDSGVYFLKKRL